MTFMRYSLIRCSNQGFPGQGGALGLWSGGILEQFPTWSLYNSNLNGWVAVGTGDFDGFGASAISNPPRSWPLTSVRFYNAQLQEIAFQNFFNGQQEFFNTGAGWAVVGSGDYDGNNVSDILWYNAQLH